MDHILALEHLTHEESNPMQTLTLMVGAVHFVKSDEQNFVSFKFKATAKGGSNYCKVSLVDDFYTIELGSINGLDYTVVSKQEGLGPDQLKDYFEESTGLTLSVPLIQ
ncbi:hypothetical protein [Vibrio mediterranei]|uniref:hypothetical protein n=1 Tax=Vibrio mediterranei TaxID=689 RepID=UPI0040678450